MSNLIGLFEFHIAFSEILLIACTDQLLYNLRLIKLCLVCAKQNAVVNASDQNAYGKIFMETSFAPPKRFP